MGHGIIWYNYLVGGLEHFFHRLGIMVPSDFQTDPYFMLRLDVFMSKKGAGSALRVYLVSIC